jgi:hypothetical protein
VHFDARKKSLGSVADSTTKRLHSHASKLSNMIHVISRCHRRPIHAGCEGPRSSAVDYGPAAAQIVTHGPVCWCHTRAPCKLQCCTHDVSLYRFALHPQKVHFAFGQILIAWACLGGQGSMCAAKCVGAFRVLQCSYTGHKRRQQCTVLVM